MSGFMPIRLIWVLASLCGSLAFWSGARAQTIDSEVSASPQEVSAWLARIHVAANSRNFLGTFVVTGGGKIASARIAHYCEGVNQFERIETLDGQARLVLRHNDTVQTVWPDKRIAVIQERALLTTFPALFQAGEASITEFYDVYKERPDRVAGHEAHVLLVRPKDSHRYGYRLWSEKVSGLLLRADVLGDRSEVLETSAFSDVAIGVKAQSDSIVKAMKRLDGYRVERPALIATSLESEGWTLRSGVPGFRRVSCVKSPPESGGSAKAGDISPLVQAIYSDGLTHVSLFIEPYNGSRHVRPLLASVGATQTMMQRHGDWWVTVVGDVPPSTLRMFAKGLERRP